MKTIEQFESIIDGLTIDFINYMFPEYIDGGFEDYYWIGGDRTGVLEINDTYWNLNDIYQVLKHKYDKDLVFDWYEYSLYFSGEDREFYLNLHSFSYLYKGPTVKEWASIFHKKRKEEAKLFSSTKYKK